MQSAKEFILKIISFTADHIGYTVEKEEDMKEYVIELRVTVEDDVLSEYENVSDLIYQTTEDVPFSFNIEDCREVG